MSASRIASRYAKSLIDLADEQGKLETILKQINMDVPFPIPFLVINSLNHKIIIEPDIKVKLICVNTRIFQLNIKERKL